LNIVLYVVLSRLFAKRPEYWGMFRRPASEKGGGGTFGSKPAAKNVPSA